ncbi:MAG TPA: IS110 family transposase [Nitrososphaera sp.]|jgi:transposase|nr:IS110 family transposase [Nitrososphaera sp.]
MANPPAPRCLVGLDIASLTFTARLLCDGTPCGPVSEFANTPTGYQKLQRWLKQHTPHRVAEMPFTPEQTLVVMEATGVYWEECALILHQAGYRVNVVNPAQVKAFARTILRRVKTDATDADLIARFALSVPLPAWNPPNLQLEALQLIMRQRETLLAMLTEEQNRLHALERRPAVPRLVIKTTRQHIAFLKRKIKDSEDAFKNDLKKHPQWQHSLELLTSIPGIGTLTAAVLLTETGAFGSFLEARQLTAYSGIAPAPHTSGSSVRGRSRISKIGNGRLRRALYMAALSAARVPSPLRAFYQRLRESGKPAKVALVALARKLLELAFAIVKSSQPYDPTHGVKCLT